MTRYSKNEFIEAVRNSLSWYEVCRRFGLKCAGGNVGTLKSKAKLFEVDYSHFRGRGWNRGNEALNKIPLKNYLVYGSSIKGPRLKKRLVEAGFMQDVCIECGQLPYWKGKPLVLEMDHKNGDPLDNRLNNLRILCGHCHSQTPTFRGRKKVHVVQLSAGVSLR